MPWFCCVITRKQYQLLIGKKQFSLKKHAIKWLSNYLHKNDLVNIVTKKSYCS